MSQTVIGIFDTQAEANQAVQELVNNGVTRTNIDVSNRAAGTQTTGSTTDSYYENDSVSNSVSGFFGSLFGSDNENTHNYSRVAHNSESIVTVHAQSAEEATRAAQILDTHGAIDLDERAAQYTTTSTTTATNANVNNTTTQQAEGTISVPVVEEQLAVGKRTVETGGARIRSRIVERPVEESVRLREERVRVERHAVDRAVTDADLANFKDGEITITEHSEVPVIAKEARVVEEVTIGKEATERTETVRDTVRRTDVEVEETDADNVRTRNTNS